MNEVMNTTAYFPNRLNRAKVALGNSEARYNSQVEGSRKKYFINSTRNSEEIPQWMNRTQSHYIRANSKNKQLMLNDNSSAFHGIKQTYVYDNLPKPKNVGSQFEALPRKKMRSQWQMKNHHYDFEWPKKQQRSMTPSKTTPIEIKTERVLSYSLPKYGIKQTPLHIQRQTPLKIGHTSMVDSIYTK